MTDNFLEPPILNPEFRTYAISEIFLCSIGCTLNGFLILILVWNMKITIKKPSSILLLNLAFWDFCFGSFMLSMSIKKLIIEKIFWDQFDCTIEGVISTIFGLNSFFSLFLLSTDRYIIVVRGKIVELRKCLLGIVIGALLSSFVAASPLLFDSNTSFTLQPSGYYCLIDLSRKRPNLQNSMYLVMIFYSLCMILVTINYVQIIHKIVSTRAELRNAYLKSTDTASFRSAPSFIMQPSKNSVEFYSHEESELETQTKKKELRIENFKGSHIMKMKGSRNQSKSRKKLLEIQLAIRTIYISSTHILVFIPYAINFILQMAIGQEIAKPFDLAGIYSFFIVLILDPLWSLVLDQQVKKLIMKAISDIRKKFFNLS
ncbi:Opsin-3 [Coelomomyces lativittatus]|nr:protein-chromophore linkage [Coelomomyces lativittatus]KAJ1516482.1 Opsin-3 [Coelomomyces lativittatus]KAJ1516950.1 Opsin-3 [Coelomomyces lativittatus]